MYIDSMYNYIHDFGSFLKYAKMKVESAIENGRSLKLRQMRQVAYLSLSSTTSMQPTMNEVTQPTSGLLGGLGVSREGRRVGREDKEKQEGHQVAGKHNHHHPP